MAHFGLTPDRSCRSNSRRGAAARESGNQAKIGASPPAQVALPAAGSVVGRSAPVRNTGSRMKQFLYRIQPTRPDILAAGPTERESRIVADHFAYLQDLVARGIVLMAGRTLTDDAAAFGIVVFAAASAAEAAQIVQDDPAVREGVMKAELFPYRVALWSRQGPAGDENDA
jgi:uncharacterized protein YciI